VPWLRYYNKDTARALNADSGYFNSEEILACDECKQNLGRLEPLVG
jgi:hypothetical protein